MTWRLRATLNDDLLLSPSPRIAARTATSARPMATGDTPRGRAASRRRCQIEPRAVASGASDEANRDEAGRRRAAAARCRSGAASMALSAGASLLDGDDSQRLDGVERHWRLWASPNKCMHRSAGSHLLVMVPLQQPAPGDAGC